MAAVAHKEALVTALKAFYLGNLDTGQYVPFEYAAPDGKTATYGEVRWVREVSYTGENALLVGLWKARPGLSPEYTFPGGDETFLVVEGEVTIHLLNTGEAINLKVGDFASFAKGTRSRWDFKKPFKKFVIVSDCLPLRK